jgi:flagellar protein FlgJ
MSAMSTGSLTVAQLPGPQVPGVDSYTDYKGLAAGADDRSPEGIRKAARQFESVFLHLWLKSMREANAQFGEGSYLSSPTVEAHQQMLDGEMAVGLSNAGGVGLAEIIERQLSGQGTPVRREPERIQPPTGFAGAEVAPGEEPAVENADHKRSFIEKLSSVVDVAIAGTPLPRLGVLAQAVLETGWGRHVIGGARDSMASGFNLFGIKATGWDGPSITTSTLEYLGGRLVKRQEAFRAYESMEAATSDYVDVLRGNSRYAALFANPADSADSPADGTPDTLGAVRRFADALQQGGYATDPRYADKIVNVARTILRLSGAR